mgnify:CR=1 FL=1
MARPLTVEEEFFQQNPIQYDPDTLSTAFAPPPEDEPEPVEPVDEPMPPRQPLPLPSAPMASNDPEFRPPHAGQGGGGEESYDWRRALTSLFGGSEGVSQYDRQKLAEAAQRMQERQAGERSKLGAAQEKRTEAQEKRAQEMHEALLPKRQAEAADITSKMTARDLKMPGSPASKATVEGAVSGLKLLAGRIEAADPASAKLMLKTASDMAANPGMTGMDAIKLLDRFGRFGQQIKNDALNAARIKHMGNQDANAVRDDTYRATAREDGEIKIRDQAQEKLNTEINDKTQAIENMRSIGKLQQNVNTGFITNWWSKWIGKPFDINSASRNDLEAMLARTFNKETKELAGSAVTPAEWERISPQIPQASDDDNVFRSKLAQAIAIAEDILAKRKKQYQLRANKKPTDTSITAQNAAAEGVADDAAKKDKNRARAQQIVADPNEDPKKKAKAKLWLEQNP